MNLFPPPNACEVADRNPVRRTRGAIGSPEPSWTARVFERSFPSAPDNKYESNRVDADFASQFRTFKKGRPCFQRHLNASPHPGRDVLERPTKASVRQPL